MEPQKKQEVESDLTLMLGFRGSKYHLSTLLFNTLDKTIMKERFKAFKTIHIALCLGVTLAYFFVGDLQSLKFLNLPNLDATTFIYLLIPVAAIFLGNLLFRQQLQNVDKNLNLEDQLGAYQTASIIRWALLEGAAFFYSLCKTRIYIDWVILVVISGFSKTNRRRHEK